MLRFAPLPLASEVGLPEARAALDGFLPDPSREAAARLDAMVRMPAVDGQRRSRLPPTASDLRAVLSQEGSTTAAAMVTAAWELWREHRGTVDEALNADRLRREWLARRHVADSPEARKQHRAYSQEAAALTPEAVAVADRAARTINGAMQGVTTIPVDTRKVAPSWH